MNIVACKKFISIVHRKVSPNDRYLNSIYKVEYLTIFSHFEPLVKILPRK